MFVILYKIFLMRLQYYIPSTVSLEVVLEVVTFIHFSGGSSRSLLIHFEVVRFSGNSPRSLLLRFEVVHFSGSSFRSLLLQFEVVRFSGGSSYFLLIHFKVHFSGSSWRFEVVIFNSISEKKTKILLELKYHHSSIFTPIFIWKFGNVTTLWYNVSSFFRIIAIFCKSFSKEITSYLL